MELEATYAPDLVHLNGYAYRLALARAGDRGRALVRAVLVARRARRAQEWDSYRRRTAVGLRAADLVVAPTHAFLRTIQVGTIPDYAPG